VAFPTNPTEVREAASEVSSIAVADFLMELADQLEEELDDEE
jgi:hypothetical protein